MPAHGRIYLIDTMSFIFRAYHAMARQRPMSTKTGLPTAAIYVFVNMLRKLRDDFSPEYLAAVFDVAGPTFRDEQADAVTSIRKFDIKTQTFTEVEYKGYKANRVAMPEDLAQQVPYIRRALEAYRIPILEVVRFEADDVIGTLARKAAEASHPVYVVSSDKDMMQLVNDKVQILNPPKDNLICDAAKVEEILGVPPERVVDVMALRGDSIDNIPGAPGIGDKGSVEIIKRFGSVEQALARAAEVERKTYRESLQNNRDTILFSKSMATIDTHVPIELDVDAMRVGEPDVDALRALFTELEFTSLLKELLPVVEVGETHYTEAKLACGCRECGGCVGRRRDARGGGRATRAGGRSDGRRRERRAAGRSSDVFHGKFHGRRFRGGDWSVGRGRTGLLRGDFGFYGNRHDGEPRFERCREKLRSILSDADVPKAFTITRRRSTRWILWEFLWAGVRHDPMLYSYLLDPTYSSHRLAEVALRRFNLKLAEQLAESADITGRVGGPRCATRWSRLGWPGFMRKWTCRSFPVLARMEQAGVKIDTAALSQMRGELEREIATKAKEIYAEVDGWNSMSARRSSWVTFYSIA